MDETTASHATPTITVPSIAPDSEPDSNSGLTVIGSDGALIQ